MATYEDMQKSGVEAREDLQGFLSTLTPDEYAGAKKLTNWIRRWYMSAGYKQLLSTRYGGLLSVMEE